MKHTFVLAACAAAMIAAPAQAQPVAADLLPAYEVTTIIASMGMRPVGRPAWARGRYVVAAIDRYGREVNVVLDARDGQVLAVRPLGRNSFGPPPPGYAGRPAPYGPADGAVPPPPGAVPEDEEFFDDDRQQGSLPARAPAHMAAPPREPSVTGSVPRSTPAERKDAASHRTPGPSAPVPRPRPVLAKANDKPNDTDISPTKPAEAAAAAAVKLDDPKLDAPKLDAPKLDAPNPDNPTPDAARAADQPDAKTASAPPASKPNQAKPSANSKPEAGKAEIRVIDLSKPKTAPKPEDKPGEAIRF